MTTNEYKVSLYYSQNYEKPILEFFDPLIFLREIPVFLSHEIINIICDSYLEKIRRIGLIDLFFIQKLALETTIKNPIYEHLFERSEYKKKARLLNIVVGGFNLPNISAVEYFTSYPYGKIPYLEVKKLA